jgi:hypothetical protein
MDETFKSTPTIFSQIYTIHCFARGQMVAIAYGLLPNRRKDTYRRFLLLFKRKADESGVDFAQSLVQIDFEMAMLRALKDVFPAAQIRGCFFHFTQCLWRKVQELGLNSFQKQRRRAETSSSDCRTASNTISCN